MFVSVHAHLPPEPLQGSSTLEILWQQDVSATVCTRAPDGSISAGGLRIGIPAVSDLANLGEGATGRHVDLDELLALAAEPPAGLELGGSARATFAVLRLAERSVTEGLLHPQLQQGGRTWLAYWGATIDERVQEALGAIAAAFPPVCAEAFGGDRDALAQDLYACAVDQIARDRLQAACVQLGNRLLRSRPSGPELFLDGLTSADPELPPHAGLGALERRVGNWVDAGLEHRSAAPWLLSLHLDELETTEDAAAAVALELWLQAADDPTLVLPVELLDESTDGVFAFLRASDPRAALHRQLGLIEPVLAEGGLAFDPALPLPLPLSDDDVRFVLLTAIPRLEALGVPVLLPRAWLRRPSPLRVNLVATGTAVRSSGLLGTDTIAHFDWKLAIGDTDLTEAELAELAAAKEPLIRVRGRWHALDRSEVERALRFLERRREGSVVDLVRAVAGIELDDAGLELGVVTLDDSLRDLLAGSDERRYRPLPTPAAMTQPLFPFQERGHGWLRMLGDLGIGAILADDMGLGKTVQALAMLASEREQFGAAAFGPTLVVCPMSVTRQWAREAARFVPSLRVHVHHGGERLSGEELTSVAGESDLVVTSYDIATRDADALAAVAWDRLVLDEAQDVKNPATKRARALRRLNARRVLALTGTPIENRLDELWAIMDIVNPGLLGSRERFQRTFARPIEAYGDSHTLERLRSMVGPFILRRPKDSPEVEIELPRITVRKEYCNLTLEQASLYRATVDRWLPRIEEHERSFGRRGAVLAMLSQLKQVCNHPETILPTGRPLGGRSGKLERLVELLAEMPDDDKALVFTQYPGFDRLVPHLRERLGREVGFFHGGLAARERDALVEAFSGPGGPSLLVVSIRAGGRGLNLPAANHVFHFDRWWNPAVEQQATDRAYRFGQHKDVFVHSLICTATVEERIDELLDTKRELAEKVVAGRADDWLGELDLETIRAAVTLSDTAVEAA